MTRSMMVRLLGLALLWNANSCVPREQESGSNSNWVSQCQSDLDCPLRSECWCNACRAECTNGSDCSEGRCAPSEELGCQAPSKSHTLCIADCEAAADCEVHGAGLDCVNGTCLPAALLSASEPSVKDAAAEPIASVASTTVVSKPAVIPTAGEDPGPPSSDSDPGPAVTGPDSTSGPPLAAPSSLDAGSSLINPIALSSEFDADAGLGSLASASGTPEATTSDSVPSASDAGTIAPILVGQFELWPSGGEVPRCDLGGVLSDVRVCLPRTSAEEGCSQLGVETDGVMAMANENYTCGSSWTAGIACGPVLFDSETGPACCWDVNGTCSSDPVVPAPEFPLVAGEFEIWQGDGGAPQCDLGGGVNAVRSCLPVTAAQVGCSGLTSRTQDAMTAASSSYTCGEAWNYAWSAGIACGPVLTATDTGDACCWDLDGFCSGVDTP